MPSATGRNRAPQRHTPELASLDTAATFLDCNIRTVRRMIASGQLRGYRVGRYLKIDMRQVRDEIAKPIAPESVAC